jgi:ornithine carbamoyltransferase
MMLTTFAFPRLLRAAEVNAGELECVLDLAARMKAGARSDALAGETVALVFEKPSTRTRVSLAAAVTRLGGAPLVLGTGDLQLGRGETIEDTARVLSRYCAAVTIRTFAQDTLQRFASAATVPVINALSDEHHPLQALADLMTVRERFGQLEGLRVAFVGDGGSNVCASLVEAGRQAGMSFAIATPPAYAPAELDALVTGDPAEAVHGADVVVTDVHVSMGDEAERERRLADLAGYRVTPELMAMASPEAIFMHCLPAHRGQEVAAEVIDGPQSVVWDEAENRMHTAQAVLHILVTGDWGGARCVS